MKRSTQGLTILEALIAAGLFLLALAICGQLAVMGVRARNQGMDRNSEFRRVITLFHLLERDIRACQDIYFPQPALDFQAKQPGVLHASLVLRHLNADNVPEVAGWALRGDELSRVTYRPDFNPPVSASHQLLPDTKVSKSRGVESFIFRREPPGQHFGAQLVYLEVRCPKPLNQVIATRVALRR